MNACVLADPSLYLHQLDLIGRRALFVRLSEAELRAASFLDERLLATQRDGFWLPLAQLPQADTIAAPANGPDFIFHIGHCGSTLLSRLLDQLPQVLGLREPLPLRTLSEAVELGATPLARIGAAQREQLLRSLLALYARGRATAQRVIIKATSNCNALIAPVLQAVPNARAILIYIPLETYLATILKSPGARNDALCFAPARRAELHRQLGQPQPALYDLDDSAAIALGWLAEVQRFSTLAAAHPARLQLLDFHELLGAPTAVLTRVARHYGLTVDAPALAAICAGPVMSGYAKAPEHGYNVADREHDLAESRRRYAAEIEAGLQFAKTLAASTPSLARLLKL